MLDKSMVVVNRVRVFVMMDTVVVCNSYVVYESVCREVCINMVACIVLVVKLTPAWQRCFSALLQMYMNNSLI